MSIKYARCGDAHIAYRTIGDGPIDLVYIPSLLVSFEAFDDNPYPARFLRRLASFSRLIQFDVRGVGMSDAGQRPLSIDLFADDLRGVLDAVGSEAAALVVQSGAGPIAIALAAREPDRVRSLVFVNAYSRLIRSDDYPIGYPEGIVAAFSNDNTEPSRVGDGQSQPIDLSLMAPSLQHDPRFSEWWQRSSTRAASPDMARRWLAVTSTADVRAQLPSITASTLVLTRAGDVFVPPRFGRYIAQHVAEARYVELPGADDVAFSGDSDALADEIEEFLTGRRSGSADRVLTTLLFTDIVDSTTRASALGDHAWRAELDAHDAAVRVQLARFGGREVNTTGDGFVAVFDAPTVALECGRQLAEHAGMPVRVGVHLGECERRGDDVAGLAVHIAARVAACAGPGEVLASRTVRDAVVGSAVRFDSRGEHQLKGVDEPWQLFALMP